MNSVLFVRLSAMGDLVQSLGAVASLLAARPEVQVTLVTQASLVPLVRDLPGLRRVVGFRRDGGLRAVRQVRDELRQDRYDVALDLQGNWKSALIARVSGAGLRLGAAGASRREPWSRILLDRTVSVAGVPHPARIAWELVRAIAPDAPFRLPRLAAGEAEVAAEREAVRRAGVAPDRPFRVVVVTDPVDPRALRPSVVEHMVRSGDMPALLVMGPDDARPPDVGGNVLRHGVGEARRLVALGAVVARANGVVLGPDQGPTHVLVAAGARCVAMFGAQDPLRTAPPAAVAVVHPKPPVCSPCRRRRCDHPDGPVCMRFEAASGRQVATGLPADDS